MFANKFNCEICIKPQVGTDVIITKFVTIMKEKLRKKPSLLNATYFYLPLT